MNRYLFTLVLVCYLLRTDALGQKIGAEIKSLTLNTVEEGKGDYDLLYPTQVVGRLTYDGIIVPVILMDGEDNWHKIPPEDRVINGLSSDDFKYYAYSQNKSFSPVSARRMVSFMEESSYFIGFIAGCDGQDVKRPCLIRDHAGGIVLTWQDAPAFFEQAETIEAKDFQYHSHIVDAFLKAETNHIAENKHYEKNGRFYTYNGGVPVYKPERDSASIQITYWKSGALKDSLFLYVVKARKEYPNPCRKSTQNGLLIQSGEEVVYMPDYYFAIECSSKGAGAHSFPVAAFTFKNRVFIMEEQYGYEGMDFAVDEVILGN